MRLTGNSVNLSIRGLVIMISYKIAFTVFINDELNSFSRPYLKYLIVYYSCII